MNLPGLILDAGAPTGGHPRADVADATHHHEGRVLPTGRHQPAAAAVAANVLSSVVKRGDHRRRSFELLAKPSVLVRSGGELPRSDWDWRHHRLPTPFPQNGFRAVDDGDRTSGRIQSGRGTVP